MKKKIYLAASLLLMGMSSFAQFFDYTPYRGAFGDATSSDWTQGWAEFDPENKNYGATTVTVSTDITTNTTWSTGTIVKLQNKVYVTNGATLTIQPGVIIRGDKATEGTLIISKGSKIDAVGTSTNPIVFTSNFDVADGRQPGDWGGLVVLGNAVINSGTAVVEGGLDAVKASYGGTDDNDNSGRLSYIRIEFAGFPFQPDKEINGLTLGGVGSGTQMDHIQVSFCNDDAFEWFGGNVNAKYLVSYRNVDDDFDADFGYRGNVQFGLIVRDHNLSDQCTCSSSEGFEVDNNGSGTSALPITNAIFSNITLIGPKRGGTVTLPSNIDIQRAFRIRRNSALSVYNAIATDWKRGMLLDGNGTMDNLNAAALDSSLRIKAITFAGNDKDTTMNGNSTNNAAWAAWYGDAANGITSLGTDPTAVKFVNPYPDFDGLTLTPDYRLQTGSPALTGSIFDIDKMGTITGITSQSKVLYNVQAYPNPANSTVYISVSVDHASELSVNIIDVTGKLVRSVKENDKFNAGNHLIPVDVQSLNNGIYFVEVLNANDRQVARISVVK